MIITICREFGSGGRELGKRLSDLMSIPCYDNEIIKLIAEQNGFDENYVAHISESSIKAAYPMTIGHRFSYVPHHTTKQAVEIAAAQRRIIENFAQNGDCIIVGRCADVILQKYRPFKIFVYASMESKVQRCIERMGDEKLTRTQVEQKIIAIDKERAGHRALYTSQKWGEKIGYNLCVNTSETEIKHIVPGVAAYIHSWFDSQQ